MRKICPNEPGGFLLAFDILYRILYTDGMTKTLSVTKARQELTTLVDNASKKLTEYIITVKGSPAAVLISAAEYESWKETNEIMADKELLKSIRQGEADIKKGNYTTLEQLKKDLKL